METETLKTYLRPLYHSYVSLRYSGRAKKINDDYAAHYRHAREVYLSDGNIVQPSLSSLDDVQVTPLFPISEERPFVSFPDNYSELVKRMRLDVQSRLQFAANCRFFPKIDIAPSSLPLRVADVKAMKQGDVIALQLKSYRDLDGLDELCSILMPQLERAIFGTYLVVDKVYAYRNLISRQHNQVSWRWHADNHPGQIKKIAIYLTDVDPDSGAMEYLRSPTTGKAAMTEPKPLLGVNITPRKLAEYRSKGFEPYRLTGKSGTAVLFDENIIHKANIPSRGYRDAIFLQIRPSTFRPERYIDERWTGSFEHVDFNLDPYDYQPRPKSSMHSSAY
jgi:hypothetical protein